MSTREVVSQRRVSSGSISGNRTNLFLRSEDLANVYWTKSNCSISADVASLPDGLGTMDKIVEDGTTSTHGVVVGVTAVGREAYTISAFVMPAERSSLVIYGTATDIFGANFNLLTGQMSNFVASGGVVYRKGIENWGNGLYRCYVSGSMQNASAVLNCVVAPEAVFGTQSYLGNGVSGIIAGGLQCEIGDRPTTYMKSVAAQGTGLGYRSRMASWSAVGDVGGAVLNFRDGSASGPIINSMDVPVGVASPLSSPGNTQDTVFPNGIYMEVASGSVSGFTIFYSD